MQINQKGKPISQTDSDKQSQLMDERLAFLKLVNMAERDIVSGRVMNLDEVMKTLIKE
ncbi:hypothetical protein [Thalassomonas sp. RHCl1]|uniref:hypothetical protein n=1 Tax=Thalassomonas sp. RHCl1 TaxID=2995320 RepID=UPI00248AC875|nr:hypothetical protein [Thalassomonas sp. RHCl1]